MSIFDKLFPQTADVSPSSSLPGTTWTMTEPAGDSGVTVSFQGPPTVDFNEVTVTADGVKQQGYWFEAGDEKFVFQLPQSGTPMNFSEVFYGTHGDGKAQGVFFGLTRIQPFAMTKTGST